MQKRLKVTISSDEAMIKSQKYTTQRVRISDRAVDLGARDDEPLGGDRTHNVNEVGTVTHECKSVESGGSPEHTSWYQTNECLQGCTSLCVHTIHYVT